LVAQEAIWGSEHITDIFCCLGSSSVVVNMAAHQVGMLEDYSVLSYASLRLLIGGFVAVAGAVHLLTGFLLIKEN